MRTHIFVLGLVCIVLLFSGCTACRTLVGVSPSSVPTSAPTAITTPTAIATTEPAGWTSTITTGPGPIFSIHRTDNMTILIHLESRGGVSSLRGFHVLSPPITNYMPIPPDQPLGEGETIIITDPNLRGRVHLVANSSVNGQEQVVIDAMV